MKTKLVILSSIVLAWTSLVGAEKPQREVATLGSGCFWCTEAVFEREPGVVSVVSGYTGGHVKNPTYEQICGKKTGHAEVTQITFDPTKTSFERSRSAPPLPNCSSSIFRPDNAMGFPASAAAYPHHR